MLLLRFAESLDYSVPRTRTKLGDRAFSVVGPVTWNSLPTPIRRIVDTNSFKKLLKTHFMSLRIIIHGFIHCQCNPGQFVSGHCKSYLYLYFYFNKRTN